MEYKKGQSLIEIVFSIGIVILVLTGVVILIVSTANAKRRSLERNKATELSQTLMENKVLQIKKYPLDFWNAGEHPNTHDNQGSDINSNYVNYLYDIEYKDCDNQSCNIVITVKWGESETLSTERFFSRAGL